MLFGRDVMARVRLLFAGESRDEWPRARFRDFPWLNFIKWLTFSLPDFRLLRRRQTVLLKYLIATDQLRALGHHP